MNARGRAPLTASLALALSAALFAPPAFADPANVQASRIPLYPSRPSDNRAGSLVYRGGLELSSGDSRFGGWSDLAVNADGSALLSISDVGRWMRARLTYDPRGDLSGFTDADIAPMLDPSGAPLTGPNRDAEGMALQTPNDLNGTVAVSFERNVRIWRYDLSKGLNARPTVIPIGDWVKPLHYNQQLEAIALWKPDTLLAFAEEKVNPGDDQLAAMEAYPGDGVAHTRMLSVVPHDPFAITSAANAPDGGIFILERRYSLAGGVGMELRHVGANEIRPGARLQGEVLANLSFQDTNIDNMEGVAVRKGPRGETLLYMISDDNFSPIQRTLLLMFELAPRR